MRRSRSFMPRVSVLLMAPPFSTAARASTIKKFWPRKMAGIPSAFRRVRALRARLQAAVDALGRDENNVALLLAHLLGELFVAAFRRAAHRRIEILQPLDVRGRVLPRLDRGGTFHGHIAPRLELDDGKGRAPRALDVLRLDRPGARGEADLAVQHGGRDDGRLRAAFRIDRDRDAGVIILQQRERFFPFHRDVPPKIESMAGTITRLAPASQAGILRLRY